MARKKRVPLRVTSIQVAEMAGVSQATVSRVFKDGSGVVETTRNRVLEAAKTLGYMPNRIASSLSSNRTNIIAVVLYDICNQFYTNTFAEFARRFQENNRQILFFETRSDQKMEQIFSRVLEYQVDGIVVTAPALPPELTEEFVRVQVPVVLFNRFTDNQDVCAVCSDNVEAGRTVANHLLNKGYTSFAFIGGRETSSGRDRCKGFVDRLQERGTPTSGIKVIDKGGDYTYQFGWDTMLRLWENETPPNGIFCSNDSIAVGALDAARRRLGLRVPQDVGIVGFDDTEMCAWPSISLTTVHQPMEIMVEETCKYLFSSDQDPSIKGGLHLFHCKLVERGTT